MSGPAERYRLGGMARRTILTLASLLAVLLGSIGAAAPAALAMGADSQLSSDPIADQGSSYHYRSYIRAVTPTVAGLSFQILEFADRILLINHTGQTVTVDGYQGEPYARVLANGSAELNTRSPATYLDKSFYGNITVPASADPKAPPQWTVIDRTGQLEWHDHRIHWPSPLLPPQVKDKGKRTLIFNWRVPIVVGSRQGAVTGQLYWVPATSKTPVAAIIVGVAIALAGLAFVAFVRRRRRNSPDSRGAPQDPAAAGPGAREAW
jgi:LPXTG-motif cell wall-anchored protein